MKKIGYLIFLISQICLNISCNGERQNSDDNKNSQTNNAIEKSIIGKWGGLGETSPVWDIRKDSIYYFQYSKAYAYKIVDDNMIVNFENSPTIFKNIHVKGDTIFFIDNVGLSIKGYRFK